MDGLLLVKLSWLTVVLLGLVQGEDLTMDSVVNCGRTVHIYDREYTIKARADITTTKPDYRCILVIDSGYSDSYYQIQITLQMVAIEDCGVRLAIYEGSSAGGATVKRLGCVTRSTGILYSKYGTITFEFITPKEIYRQRNDFNIKVKAFQIPRVKTTTYGDPNAPAYAEGGSRLPAGAIGGIVVGLVVLIAFTIILLWCYKARRLPGMSKYRKHAISMQTFFATDASVMQHYYPPNQYEVQNQVYPIIGYDAFGNPVYGNPVQSAMPYTQAGQPVYYVDQNGYPVDPQQQPMQYQTPTDFHPEMPGYTSTPSNLDQTPHRKHSPHHRRKQRTKSAPYHNAIVATPGAPSPIMPAGNILDDPRIPPPGTTLMNSGVDPHTGVRSSQVVWTDANPDPTDPTGDNPQITRETIV